jgi:hypothetical protein
MESNTQTDNTNPNESGKFLKNIGNKLVDEDDGSKVKGGSLNKELEGLKNISQGNEVK